MSEDLVYTPDMMQGFLVKFFFKDGQFHLIPEGIEEKDRDTAKKMDRRHRERAEEIGMGDRGRIGRKRPGRTDDGDDFTLTNVRFTYGDSLHLVGCHRHFQEGKPAKGRKKVVKSIWVITLAYAVEAPEKPFELDRKILAGIKGLQERAWSMCHVWSNPSLLGTLNFKGLNDSLPESAVTSYIMGAAEPAKKDKKE